LAQYDSLGLPVVAVIDGGQNRQLHLLDRQVKGAIAGLAWAPDGERLAVNYRVDTGLTLIWNARTGQVEQEIEGFYAAAGLGWSADGQALFGLQSLDGQIHAVAVNTGRPQRGLDGHASVGSFLTWTQDRLASTNGATLTWWDPQDGQPLRRETIGSPQAWVIS
jgi:WD40 repeat protein